MTTVYNTELTPTGAPVYTSVANAALDVLEWTGFRVSFGPVAPGTPDPPREISIGTLVHASRLIDALRFKTDPESGVHDDPEEVYRFPMDGEDVPDRIAKAVALIAFAYDGEEGATVSTPARVLAAVRASSVALTYADGLNPREITNSDMEILATRLGIPSVDATRLLYPYLVLPEDFLKRYAPLGGGIFISINNVNNNTNILNAPG